MKSMKSSTPSFDLVVITAANAAQARGYRAQLKGRAGYRVVADPGGRRVGSLGATVNVLRHLPAARRVLICHSGGDAKRTPAYAAQGKAFVPMPDGRPMLDHIVEAMAKLPRTAGVTVCCGDVIPRLDYAKVAFARTGVTGVAFPDGPWQAQRHGVYVTDGAADGVTALRPVTDFLQKPKVSRGRFLIDTGILHFDWKTAEKMKALPVAGDIYEEFPAQLLKGFAPFAVSVVPTCEFFHIGSSRELLTLLGKDGRLVDGVAAPIAALGGENVVTNVPADYGPVRLGKGECLTALPLGAKEWYYLRYRLDDTFKTDGLWEKHELSDKMKRINHARLLALHSTIPPFHHSTITVTAPVRIDFAGGWSDTPPICEIEGGTVLTAAVRLDGKRPIEVCVEPRRDKLVRVVSRDLGKRTLLRSAAEIADHHDPHDWSCLVKAALAVTGFRFGTRGLSITISADLPKGSGMGTSSILGAATIAALLAAAGELPRGPLSASAAARVGALTLALEREMRTGGGWEDQFAGMLPGVKMLRSKPGTPQEVRVTPVAVRCAAALRSRSLLYFTGQKRMARNVLRRVLGFYAANPHNFGKILINAIKDGAERACRALEKGDLETFASCVNDYWRDKKLLDAGSTNEKVDDIIDTIRPYCSAVSLAGAGGGGFMYILAKSPASLRKIRAILTANPPSPTSRFYTFDMDETGLVIS